ncbi:hypothetical protein [Saccharopolyspora gregorii]|uniref:ATP-dependent DNA ligase family profile domain-containing protein n=1 Tax=Saccharopolyspora gregorii TaxID=33914 RepID=A0ABP6RM20_9PSEU
MLASPADTLAAALDELGDCVVEHKLDGRGIQLHRDREQVRVFTRTLREITGQVRNSSNWAWRCPARRWCWTGGARPHRLRQAPPVPGDDVPLRRRGPRDEVLRPHFFDLPAPGRRGPGGRAAAPAAGGAGPRRTRAPHPRVCPGNAEDADALLDDALDAGTKGSW